MPKNGESRLVELDIARGLAVLLVFFMHLFRLIYDQTMAGEYFAFFFEEVLLAYVDLGKIGVVLFFCVSGYVIPFSFRGKKPAISFAVSRFFRLYPAYWVSLAFGSIIVWQYYQKTALPDFQTVLFNLTMLQKVFGYEHIIGVYWTLQIELIFYFICFLLFLTGGLNRSGVIRSTVCVLMIFSVISALFRYNYGVKIPVAIPLSLSLMFLSLLYRQGEFSALKGKVILVIFILLVLPLSCWLAYDFDLGHQENWLRYLFAYWLAVLLFAILLRLKFSLSSGLKFISWVGGISYSIYLMHMIVLIGLFEGFRLFFHGWSMNPYIFGFVSLLATLYLSSLLERWVENPMIGVGKKVYKAFENRT